MSQFFHLYAVYQVQHPEEWQSTGSLTTEWFRPCTVFYGWKQNDCPHREHLDLARLWVNPVSVQCTSAIETITTSVTHIFKNCAISSFWGNWSCHWQCVNKTWMLLKMILWPCATGTLLLQMRESSGWRRIDSTTCAALVLISWGRGPQSWKWSRTQNKTSHTCAWPCAATVVATLNNLSRTLCIRASTVDCEWVCGSLTGLWQLNRSVVV